MKQVHGPGIVQLYRRCTAHTQPPFDRPFVHFIVQLKTELPKKPVHHPHVHSPTIGAQEVIHAPIAIAEMRLVDLLDAIIQKGRNASAGLVVIGRTINLQSQTSPKNRSLPFLPYRVNKLTLPIRPQSFRLITSCSISQSSVRSATIFLNRLFLSSS